VCKVRDFLRVARAHQPEETPRTFMDPLADAVCCAAKWLKSSSKSLVNMGKREGQNANKAQPPMCH
jgi:hypothetical protein